MNARLSRELIVAAHLADPVARGAVDFRQETNWAVVLAILLQNKVPLVGLSDDPALSRCPLLELSGFQSAKAEDAKVWRKQRDEYAKLRDRFLQRGIESVLFKSTGLAPSFPYTSGNLDTLVRPEHIEWAREVLQGLGYVELRNIEEPQKFLFRLFENGESVSAIHLHGTVGWGVPFVDDAALWRRVGVSEDDPLVVVPGPEDGILVTIAHTFYEDKAFRLLDLAGIRHALRVGNPDFAEIERVARERGWEDGLSFCLLLLGILEDRLYGERSFPEDALAHARSVVASSAWLSRRLERVLARDEIRFPFRVSFLFGKMMYYRKILKDPLRRRAARAVDVFSTLVWGVKLKLHIRGQRGFVASFSGIDGSGKTLRVRALTRAFEISEIDARAHWSRFGSSAQAKGPTRQGPGTAEASDTASSLHRRRGRLRNPVVRFCWLAYHLAGIVCRYNLRVRVRRWLRGVVICDRYVYDAAVEIDASLPHNPRWSRWAERVLTILCPRPNVAWLLDVPADRGVDRQSDERGNPAAREELERQRGRYLDLARALGLRVVSTGDGRDEATNRVVRETLLAYYDDYHTWVNALLLSNPNQMNPRKRVS
jgi:thymidylate kinase